METSLGGPDASWRTTMWTLVSRAREAKPEERRRAIESLVALYWRPVYGYIRRKGEPVEDAKDLTQAFFADFLERESLANVSADRGRFRSYLRAAVGHFLSNEFERRTAAKRGGGAVVAMDFAAAEQDLARAPELPPDRAFERAWAMDVLKRAIARLAGQVPAPDLDAFKRHLALEGRATYAELAAQLGCAEHDIANRLHRVRRRLMELVAEEVRGSVVGPKDVLDEVREIFRAISENE